MTKLSEELAIEDGFYEDDIPDEEFTRHSYGSSERTTKRMVRWREMQWGPLHTKWRRVMF